MTTSIERKEPLPKEDEMVSVRTIFPMLPGLGERFEELFDWPVRWTGRNLPAEIARLPPVDVFEEGDAVVAKAELPGLAREDLDVRISGDVLTISGTKVKEEKIERKDYHRYERSSGSFSRSVTLPAEVDLDTVTAHLKDGVLEVRAQRSAAARARTRKVEVT